MTIGITANDWQTEQILKQLNKQIPVIKVIELLPEDSLIREILIIKVSATVEHRREIKDLADLYKASVLDVTQNTLILEATGSNKKIESFIEHMRSYGLIEMARSSSVGMQRGSTVFSSM
jgi:acetolactate synthase-1/3 small subunit